MPSTPRDIEAIYTAVRLRLSQAGSPSATTGGGPVGPPGPAGPPGPPGVVWRGAWAADEDYSPGDIVTHPSPVAPPCLGGALLTYFCLSFHTSVAVTNEPAPGGTPLFWHEMTSGALIVDGLRAMTCNLDMDSHEVDNVEAIDFTLTPTHTHAPGGFHWDDTGAPGIQRPVVDVANGQQLTFGSVYLRVQNAGPSVISPLEVVCRYGVGADVLGVWKADRFDDQTHREVVGVAMHSIPVGQEGWICLHGEVRGVDTSAWGDGGWLYLGSLGQMFQDPPPLRGEISCAGANVRVGWVVLSDSTDGIFFVSIERTPFLTDLQDYDGSHSPYTGPNYYDVPQWLENNPPIEGTECNAWRPRPPAWVPSVQITDGSYDVQPKDVHIVCDCQSGQATVVLPPPGMVAGSEDNRGRTLFIKKLDCTRYCVVIDGNGYNVEGESTQRLKKKGEAVQLHSDGTEWWAL